MSAGDELVARPGVVVSDAGWRGLVRVGLEPGVPLLEEGEDGGRVEWSPVPHLPSLLSLHLLPPLRAS